MNNHKEFRQGLGRRIRTARGGRTQTQISEELGWYSNLLSQYEVGRRSPNPYNLVLLAKVLGCSTDYLLGMHE